MISDKRLHQMLRRAWAAIQRLLPEPTAGDSPFVRTLLQLPAASCAIALLAGGIMAAQILTPHPEGGLAEVVFTGAPVPPAPNERPAWKDTVKAFSGLDAAGNVTGLVTRIIAKYDLPAGARVSPGDKFRYVYHCHIREHEDNEMMRPFDVVA